MPLALEALANKRRIADDIAALFRGQNLPPVNRQGVGADNIGLFVERQTGVMAAQAIADSHIHLMIGQPQGNGGYLHGPLINLKAVALTDVARDDVADIEMLHLPAVDGLDARQLQES